MGLRCGREVVLWKSMTPDQISEVLRDGEKFVEYPDDRPITEQEAIEDIRGYIARNETFEAQFACWLFRRVFRMQLPEDLRKIKQASPEILLEVPPMPVEEPPFAPPVEDGW